MRLVAAIVAKNEARIIARCIRSVAQFVDSVVLLDTGSTDGTADVAADECFEQSVPLLVREAAWTGFAAAYSLAFETARVATDYVWILDADHVVEPAHGFEMPDLSADGYAPCRIEGGDWENWYPAILRADRPWRYVGERHAAPTLEGAHPLATRKLRGLDVHHMNDGASGSLSDEDRAARYARDADHFRARLERDHNDTRAMFYLAQSLRDAGQHAGAMAAYRARAEMSGGNAEEAYLARLTLARYAVANDAPSALIEKLLRAAHVARPHRAEAPCEMAAWLNAQGRHREALNWARAAIALGGDHDDRFLVRRSDHTWRPYAELETALSALA